MKDYVALADAYFKAHQDYAMMQTSLHRRAIVQNFIEHAALEYSTDRWREILDPERTVENPVYHIRMGTPDVMHFTGRDEVLGFYSTIKEGVLTNEFINIAVEDWGFNAFAKTHLFIPGQTLARQGSPIDDPTAFYHVEMPLIGLYWEYDERARLISENVYDILSPIFTKMDPALAPKQHEVDAIVRKYLPPLRAAA